jgi:hypothetical protein
MKQRGQKLIEGVPERGAQRMPEVKRGQERGGWRKLHSIMLNFYSSPNINTVIKSRTYV